ncbi:DUF2029 domain-containing protein [Mucilaginibacter mali]|uniref:DUF2029 domain-containing protein n=1 Tax=Mucilaginibacter mali TaxID=2740462 RepID=A0A7D4UPB2_9SPHI|nr:glycosyltransferase family 87 protein [Mucilaginibacter mali]QKJ30200.1 DUF2029 domain-containing protein [Mucilaginibacter mali]
MYNNYVIFKQVYFHTVAQTDLYKLYPGEYYDSNHYGPVFSMFVAPFALMSDGWGLLFWSLLNAVLLLWAVDTLPLSNKVKMLILLCSSIEFANSVHNIQFNPIITAFIIFSFRLVRKGKDEWATLFIVLGALIKLYPIIGLAFFMFSKNKGKFIGYTVFWFAFFLVLPAVISSPHFVVQSYTDWYHSLLDKNHQNIGFGAAQDISFMGVCRRMVGNPYLPNTPFLLFGAVVFGLPLLRFSQFTALKFRLRVLASALLTVVLFSTGSEHPTYVIAVTGAMLWMFLQDKPFTTRNIIILVLLLVITGLGLTDAFPKYLREEIVSNYVLKAWPCIIVWFILSYELMFKDFTAKEGIRPDQPQYYKLLDKKPDGKLATA